MKRILVVYYSRTGHVRSVAEAIAGACAADLEAIREVRPRKGLFAWIRSAREALRGVQPTLLPPEHDVSAYDLVVLGCPVWASRVASPMRSFVAGHAARLPEIALFCTMGGNGGDKVLGELASLCGKAPIAALALRDAELEHNLTEKLAGFIQALAPAQTAGVGAE
jgi:flavodoxin